MENLPKDHPPICADCRHHDKNDCCSRFRNLVHGANIACWRLRYGEPHGLEGPCGVKGNFFEPKPKPKPEKGFWKRVWEDLTASPVDPVIEAAKREK